MDGLDDVTAHERIRETPAGRRPGGSPCCWDGLLGVTDPDTRRRPGSRSRRLAAAGRGADRRPPAAEDGHTALLVVRAPALDHDVGGESRCSPEALLYRHRTRAMVLITARPGDGGILPAPGSSDDDGPLAPLVDSDVALRFTGGVDWAPDPSVADHRMAVIARANQVDNPFFRRGSFANSPSEASADQRRGTILPAPAAAAAAGGRVPAAAAWPPSRARITTGLSAPAKRTLTAASVIGAHFEAELLAALRDHRGARTNCSPVELIDQSPVRAAPEVRRTITH